MSEGLFPHIRQLIEKSGPISIASYMELALLHPEFGYYRNHDPLGQGGDFTTAPEISQMFGEMIGLWCADVWQQLGKPEKFVLLELGPGRGSLMRDALRATSKIPGFHQAVNLYLLESNATLQKMQQEKLAEHLPIYIEDLTELPALPLLVVANEFFDAMPIRQFEKNFQGWCERLVGLENERLGFTLWPLEPMLAQLIPSHMQDALPGTLYEVSLPSIAVVRNLAKHINRYGGAALLIDYGFIEASGKSTLQAVSNHQFSSVLTRPGEVDLTAHVDFGALRHIALGQNVQVSGPVGQGAFLQALGIELRAMQLKQRATPKQAQDIDAALERLIHPDQMGSLFKVMAITSSPISQVAGF
ncbi:MAG: SAM-dependent methyltransferase [Alphaproteobacteria bacterium]